MEISIRITNALTGQVEMNFKDSIAEASIDYAHKLFSEAYPDSHVNFVSEGGKTFIFGAPHNMMQDEKAVSNGDMTWKQYCDKWYNGALSGCTFETEAELWKAQATGYIAEYDCVRVEVKHPEGGSIDFPVKSREDLANIIERHGSAITKIYPTVHSYDVTDYL